MIAALESIDYVCGLIKQELDLPDYKVIYAPDKLSELGANNKDHISILHKLGVKRLSKYIDAGADRLTDEGEKVCRELGLSFRNGACNSSQSLQKIAEEITAKDLVLISQAFHK